MSTNCGAGQEGWCAWSHSVGVDSFLLLVQVPQEVKNLILDFGPTLGFDAWLVRALIMVYSVRTIMGKKKCWCHSCAGKSFFAPEHCCFLSFRFVCLIPPLQWGVVCLWSLEISGKVLDGNMVAHACKTCVFLRGVCAVLLSFDVCNWF